MNRSLLSGALSIFLGKAGSVFLSILITPILVRLLGSGSYGDFAFVISVLAIATIVVNCGITDGIRKFIAEDRSTDRWKASVFVFYTRVAIGAVAVAVTLVLLLTATGVVERGLGPTLSQYVFVFCLLLVADQFETIGRNTLMGLGLERVSEPLVVVRRLVFGLSAIGLILLGWGATGALLGMAIGFGFVAAVMFWYIHRTLDWRSAIRADTPTVPRSTFLRYNVHTVVLILLATTLYHVDVVLVRTLIGDDAAGFYKGAVVIAMVLWFVPAVLQTLLVHSTSELWSRDRIDTINDIASRVTRYSILLVLLPLLGLAILADVFVPLYLGATFTASVDPLRLLLPGVLALAVIRPVLGIGKGKGSLGILIVATGSAAVLNLVLNLLFIPQYGTIGAAIATSIGYGSMMAFHAVAAVRLGFNPFSDLRLFEIALTALGTGIVLVGLAAFIETPILRLFVLPPVGCAVYLFLAVVTGAVDRSERRHVHTRIRTEWHRFSTP